MNVGQFKKYLEKLSDSCDVFIVAKSELIVPVLDADIYIGPVRQEDASVGTDSMVIGIDAKHKG